MSGQFVDNRRARNMDLDPFGVLDTLQRPFRAVAEAGFDALTGQLNVKRAIKGVIDATTSVSLRFEDLRDHTRLVPEDVFKHMNTRRRQLFKIVAKCALEPAVLDTLSLMFPFRQDPAMVTIIPWTLRPSSVPLQWRYRGRGPIKSSLADTPCSTLGIDGLLDKLNTFLGTRYSMDTPDLRSHLKECLDKSYDFGKAYGYLRPRWGDNNFLEMRRRMRSNRERDEEMRRNAIDGERIVHPYTPPRRVWDLYSNRVVPFWVLCGTQGSTAMSKKVWAVSHCWVYGERNSKETWTTVNEEEWPVQIPTDTSLERLRVELLNYGAEYVWLDVLCLRQVGCNNPALREKEHALDIPTIGYVYQWDRYQTVITYFNGLGRPFVVNADVATCDHHWLQRAWTLQETNLCWLPAGLSPLTRVDFLDFGSAVGGDGICEQLRDLWMMLVHEKPIFFRIVQVMQRRHSTNPVDRVTALAYLLRCPEFPTYNAREDPNTAWIRLLSHMQPKHRCDLLFRYPSPTNGKGTGASWHPTWLQLMSTDNLPLNDAIQYPDFVQLRYSRSARYYYHDAYVIKSCQIRGLHDPSKYQSRGRGKLSVSQNGRTFKFGVVAEHAQPIPEEEYVLIGTPDLQHWVVAKEVRWGQKSLYVNKISVVRMDQSTEREGLQKLNAGYPDTRIVYF